MVCLTNVATTTTESQVVYQQGRGDFNDRSQNVSGTLTGLVPGARYRIGVEVLRNDLANYHERVKSITVGGTNMGECRPDGADFDCTFFRCPFDTTTVVTASASGTVPVAMVFQGHSWDCDCDTSSWECSKENTVAGRQPMTAVARFTWIRADWIFRFYSDAACTTPVTSAQPWVLSQGPSSECYKFSGSTPTRRAHGWRFQRYWPNAPPGKQLSNVPVHELPRCFNLSGAEMMNMTHADLRSIVDSEREVWFDAVVSLGSVFGFLLLVRLAWVAYLRYLRSKPHVMISYRHLDADFANRLHQQLQAAGFVVWIDTAITPGADWRQDIAAAIEKSIAVCFIISPGSVTSKYCKEELYYASALGKPIFPLVHTEAFDSMQGGVKTILQRIQWIRMDREFDPGFDQLVGELRSLDRKAAQAVISGGRAMKKSHSSGNWVTASSGGSESKQLQITSD
eukprot:g1110.t1